MYLDYGEIQFINSEFLVAPNSTGVEVLVERIHITKDKVQVKWELITNTHHVEQNGSILFNYLDDQKGVKLDLANLTRKESIKIKLYNPTNDYQIGEISEATIIFDCIDTKFMCLNGEKCVENHRRCNGDKDCYDGSDELECDKSMCMGFWCPTNKQCVRNSSRCDKKVDCLDGSDEVNCVEKCSDDEFKCHNGEKCIDSSWRCDGLKDCRDGSDEESCDECKGFSCDNSQCVSCEVKCDGKRDCSDGSDENGCFVCKNGAVSVIRNDFVCNNVDDCSDGSDEKDCQEKGNKP